MHTKLVIPNSWNWLKFYANGMRSAGILWALGSAAIVKQLHGNNPMLALSDSLCHLQVTSTSNV